MGRVHTGCVIFAKPMEGPFVELSRFSGAKGNDRAHASQIGTGLSRALQAGTGGAAPCGLAGLRPDCAVIRCDPAQSQAHGRVRDCSWGNVPTSRRRGNPTTDKLARFVWRMVENGPHRMSNPSRTRSPSTRRANLTGRGQSSLLTAFESVPGRRAVPVGQPVARGFLRRTPH